MCFCIVWWEWRWYKLQNRQARCVFCIVWWEWRWYKHQNRQARCVFVLCGESEDGTNFRTDKLHVFLYCVVRVKMVQTSETDKLDVFLYCVVRVKMVQTSEQTSYMCFCIVWWEWRWYKLQNRQATCVFVLCGESEDGTNFRTDKLHVFLYCVVRVKMVQTSEQTS